MFSINCCASTHAVMLRYFSSSEDKILAISFHWEERVYLEGKQNRFNLDLVTDGNFVQWIWHCGESMEDFLDIRSSPKLSSALLLTAAFVHVIGYSSTHWSDGGVFYTGLWKTCILTPTFHCLEDAYTAGESTQTHYITYTNSKLRTTVIPWVRFIGSCKNLQISNISKLENLYIM